jgi:hypothetical protein
MVSNTISTHVEIRLILLRHVRAHSRALSGNIPSWQIPGCDKKALENTRDFWVSPE